MIYLIAFNTVDAPVNLVNVGTISAAANVPSAPIGAAEIASISGTVQVNIARSTSAAAASLTFTPAVPTSNSRGAAAGGNNNFAQPLNSDPESEDQNPPVRKKAPGRPRGNGKKTTGSRR